MAKALQFGVDGNLFALEPVKVERKKVYGWTETRAIDESGAECQLVSLEESGTIIIPKGGIGLGMIDSCGKWVDKTQLVAVDEQGKPALQIPSSFDTPIVLNETATLEELLDHNITSAYFLQEPENSQGLIGKLKNGVIYTFPFSYRGGYDASTAFLLESNGSLFLLTGEKVNFEFIGLDQAGVIDETNDEAAEESDELDFSMM